MKKPALYAFMAIIVLTSLASAARGSGYQSPQVLEVSIMKYEPSPAEPGNVVDIWFSLDNQGEPLQNVRIKAVPEFPFSIAPNQPEEVIVGSIPAGEQAWTKYRLLVDLAAPYGDENVSFYYTFGDAISWRKFEGEISIKPKDASVTISKYDVLPDTIRPGERATVMIELANNGRIAVQNLDATLKMDSDSHFAIVGSGNTKRVSSIAAGEKSEISFVIFADTTADIKLYAFPVTLKFLDERGQEHEESTNIAFIVDAAPEISVALEKSELNAENRLGDVSFKIVNKGVVDVKYLTVTLESSDTYTLISPSNEAYVGNLDSDDFESVDFKVRVPGKNPTFRLKVSYKDPYNVDRNDEHVLSLKLLTAEERGEVPDYTPHMAGGAAALLIIAWIVYKKFRKDKRKQH